MGDATAHYKNLVSLGRDEFLASAASAAFVRVRPRDASLPEAANTATIDVDYAETVEETLPLDRDLLAPAAPALEIYPLTKKPGASSPLA